MRWNPHLAHLVRVHAGRRLVEDQEPRVAEERVREAHPLPVALRERPDELPLDVGDRAALHGPPDLRCSLAPRDALQLRPEAQVLADPHVRARRMLVEMDHPTAGRIRVTGSPLKLLGTPPRIEDPPPVLGEDTEAILAEVLGLDTTAIARLRTAGTIGPPS